MSATTASTATVEAREGAHRRRVLGASGPTIITATATLVLALSTTVVNGGVSTPVVPDGFDQPKGLWVFNDAIPAAWVLVLMVFIVQTVRRKALSKSFLFFLAAMSVFWVETVADWGIELLYNDRFSHWTSSMPLTAVVVPWFMPFAYSMFYWPFAVAIRPVGAAWARLTGLTTSAGIVAVAVPLLYLWDLLVEGAAAYFGWWTYINPLGPSLSFASGYMPLIYPILLICVWPTFMAVFAGNLKDDQSIATERWLRVSRIRPGWHREALRLLAWCLTASVTLAAIAFLMALIRYLFVSSTNPLI